MVLLCTSQLRSFGINRVVFHGKWWCAEEGAFWSACYSPVQLHCSFFSVLSVCSEHILFRVHRNKAEEMYSQAVQCKTLSNTACLKREHFSVSKWSRCLLETVGKWEYSQVKKKKKSKYLLVVTEQRVF